jgi:hypothetical protein
MAKIKIEHTNILFGIATVEDSYDRLSRIVAIPSERIIDEEHLLLLEAKRNMPRILLDNIDVLVVCKIGKEISGGGMDPNITGRFAAPDMKGGPSVNKLVVLDLTDQTHGNANGIGMADYTTRKLVDKIDYTAIYANALTIAISETVRIPMALPSDQYALQAAVKTCNLQNLSNVRMVIIKDTLHLGEIYFSESMYEEALQLKNLNIGGDLFEMTFNNEGVLQL